MLPQGPATRIIVPPNVEILAFLASFRAILAVFWAVFAPLGHFGPFLVPYWPILDPQRASGGQLDRFELQSLPPGGACHQAKRVKEGPKRPKRAQKGPNRPQKGPKGQNLPKILSILNENWPGQPKFRHWEAQLCAWLVPPAAYWSKMTSTLRAPKEPQIA